MFQRGQEHDLLKRRKLCNTLEHELCLLATHKTSQTNSGQQGSLNISAGMILFQGVRFVKPGHSVTQFLLQKESVQGLLAGFS